MKNLLFLNSKQQIVENFLNYELDSSVNKKPEKTIYILDLLAYNNTDEQFIIDLYRNILQREPDYEEYNRYVDLLKTKKETKNSILYAFVTSPEAKKINMEIKGLDNLTRPKFYFKILLSLKKLYYYFIGY